MAAILYPVAIPKDYDLKAHFAKKRKSFYSILILLAFADPLTAMILGTDHLLDLGWAYLHWMLVCLIGGILAIRYENELFQKAFGIYWGLSLILFNLFWQFSVVALPCCRSQTSTHIYDVIPKARVFTTTADKRAKTFILWNVTMKVETRPVLEG